MKVCQNWVVYDSPALISIRKATRGYEGFLVREPLWQLSEKVAGEGVFWNSFREEVVWVKHPFSTTLPKCGWAPLEWIDRLANSLEGAF
jgi:hypothetical protein